MSWGFAGCPSCREPLISTMHFRGYEFICLCCGAKLGFLLEPVSLGEGEEVERRHAELQAEWDTFANGKLIVQGREHYANEASLKRHEEALGWLLQRTGKDTL